MITQDLFRNPSRPSPRDRTILKLITRIECLPATDGKHRAAKQAAMALCFGASARRARLIYLEQMELRQS